MLAFEVPSYLDRRYVTGQVLSGLLGGGMSSRLFQEVREKRGLCYSIYSSAWGLKDSGIVRNPCGDREGHDGGADQRRAGELQRVAE